MASGIVQGVGRQFITPVNVYLDYQTNLSDYFISPKLIGSNYDALIWKYPLIFRGQDIMQFEDGGYYVGNNHTKPGINTGYRYKFIVYLTFGFPSNRSTYLDMSKYNSYQMASLPAGQIGNYPLNFEAIASFIGNHTASNLQMQSNYAYMGLKQITNSDKYCNYVKNGDTQQYASTINNSPNNIAFKIQDIPQQYRDVLGITDELIGYNDETSQLFSELEVNNIQNLGFNVAFNTPYYAPSTYENNPASVIITWGTTGYKTISIDMSFIESLNKPTICFYPWTTFLITMGTMTFSYIDGTEIKDITTRNYGSAYIFTGVEPIGG